MWQPLHRSLPMAFASRRRGTEYAQQMLAAGLLPRPRTEKLCCENRIFNGLEFGHASMQGYRVSMEDEFVIDMFTSLPDHSIVAVFDGHAGTVAAEFSSAMVVDIIEEMDMWKKYVALSPADRVENVDLVCQALVQAFIAIDCNLSDIEVMDQSGCTAVVTIISPSHIVCASVGDSRCVLGTSRSVVSMTEDHKPENPEEHERIVKAGGTVVMNRVNGMLAMSRALGDFRFKTNENLEIHEHLVICHPDISVQRRNPSEDEILVVACDGVWDVMQNHEAVGFVSQITMQQQSQQSPMTVAAKSPSKKNGKQNGKKSNDDESDDDNDDNESDEYDNDKKPVSAQEAAEALIDIALSEGSTDNITAVIVKFRNVGSASNDDQDDDDDDAMEEDDSDDN